MASNSRRRVKLYVLNSEGDWDDMGTGHVEVKFVDRLRAACIVVRAEGDSEKYLLESKIFAAPDVYIKQQETLIVWNDGTDGEDGTDYALSFQEAPGCADLWDMIADVQTSMRKTEGARGGTLGERVTLPPANLGHIDEIVSLCAQYLGTQPRRQMLSESIMQSGYLAKLIDLYQMVDDLSSEDDYRKMYLIFRDLVLLNYPPILERLCSEEFVMPFMSALEHDPDVAPGQLRHVDFLKTKAHFVEIVPFEDAALTELVHLNFRLQYLKDVALAKVLDEGTFSTLNSLVFVNNLKIVTSICCSDSWVASLFAKMKDPDTSVEILRDSLKLLAELMDIARNLEAKNKQIFHSLLRDNGLLQVLEKTTALPDKRVRVASVEILLSMIENDAMSVRRALIAQAPNYPFFASLVSCLHEDESTTVKNLSTDVLSRLLDALPNQEALENVSELITIFYEHFARDTFAPILEDVPLGTNFNDAESLLRQNLCETLIAFISRHTARSRSFVLTHDVLPSVLSLFRCRNKFLHLSAVRVLKAVLMANNRFYTSYIIEHDLFQPVIDLFVKNGSRYNLIESAILDLFETVRKMESGHRSLLRYYVEKLHTRVEHVDYVQTFRALKLTYERGDYEESTPEASPAKMLVSDATREQFRKKILEEQHEDAWFSEDDLHRHGGSPRRSDDSDSDESGSSSASSPSSAIESVPATVSLERIEEDLFPGILQELESKKRKRAEDEDNFFDSFSPAKRSKADDVNSPNHD